MDRLVFFVFCWESFSGGGWNCGACQPTPPLMHQLLRSRHRQNPYMLFKLLVGHIDEIVSVPSCLHDELASEFFQRFPTRSAATSPEALAVLQGIALSSDTDISAMESRHAITRRFTTLRSLQTWTASLEDINVQWVMKQAAATSAKPKFTPTETESQNLPQP